MANKSEIIKYLRSEKEGLVKHLKKAIKERSFNYRTFGTEIEPYILSQIIKLLKEKRFIESKNDYHCAKNKNEFPDLTLYSKPILALEVKAGNHCRKIKGRWGLCKNSNNDMGTINEWSKKLSKFGGENIYYIFIEYSFNDKEKEIVDITINPFYKFLKVNSKGILRYREKDGNLRPKDFNESSTIISAAQFKKLISGTAKYRSIRIIKKHIEKIPKNERKKLFNNPHN
jgi:hypothetical protein